MKKLNPVQLKRIEAKKKKARFLYKQGLSTREVGAIVKRSHAWVAEAIKEERNKTTKASTK